VRAAHTWALGLVAVLLPLHSEAVTRKRIDVLEKAFDATLVESANALVRRGDVAFGVHLEGYGVLFKVEFTFVDRPTLKLLDQMDNVDSLKEYWRGVIEKQGKAGEDKRSRREQLDRIKDELVGTLTDYGATLTPMNDDDHVVIVAFPWEGAWDVEPSPVVGLQITARYGDLRAYAEERLDREAVRSRIRVVEEIKE
jgi:hypothetical protein